MCVWFLKSWKLGKNLIFIIWRERRKVPILLLPLFFSHYSFFFLFLPWSFSFLRLCLKPNPHLRIPHLHRRRRRSKVGLHFPSNLISTVSNPRPSNKEGFACRQSQGKKVPLQHQKPTGLLQIQVWRTLWPWLLMGFCLKIVVFLLYTFNWKTMAI